MEIEVRKINLIYTFDALWHASVDIPGETSSAQSRNVRSVSVLALTAMQAVESLCAKLDREQMRIAA